MEYRGSWIVRHGSLRRGVARALAAVGTLRRRVILAGLTAALAGACSSAPVVPPAPSAPSAAAVAEQAKDTPAQAENPAAPEGDPAFAPASPVRPAAEPHPYGNLWKAALTANLPWPRRAALTSEGEPAKVVQAIHSDGLADRTDVELPPSGAALRGEATREAATASGAANTPEAGAEEESLPPDAPNGRPWSEQDLADLAPYLHGIASWYGPNFHGKLTANGETYNQYGLTAAHPVLPIGTRILVENLDNGRRVWLRINDRGPYAKGRILDLSRLAAERLGMIELGTAPVRITVLKWPGTVQASFGLKPFQQYTVQSAAYPELDRAEELRERLQSRFPELPFFVEPASNGFFAVAAGPFDGEAEAKQVSRRIHRSGLSPIVRRYRN
jgi:rare lipoprotein A